MCGGAAGDALVGVGGVAPDVVEVYVFGGEDGDVQQAVGAGAEECGCKEEEKSVLFHGVLWLDLFFVDGVALYGAPDAAVDVGDVPPAGFYFGVGEPYAGRAVLLYGFVKGFFVVCLAGGDEDDDVGCVFALFAVVDGGGVAGGVVHVYVFGGQESEVCKAVGAGANEKSHDGEDGESCYAKHADILPCFVWSGKEVSEKNGRKRKKVVDRCLTP